MPRATPTRAATGPLDNTRKSIGLMSLATKSKMNGNTKLSSPEIIETKAMIRMIRVKTTIFGG